MDDTIYKVSLNRRIRLDENKKKNLEMDFGVGGGFDVAAIINKIEAGDAVIFEGDLFHTYRIKEALMSDYSYTVTPEFPLQWVPTLTCLCPICGGETVGKREDSENPLYVRDGWFCEKCNEWTLSTLMSKIRIDETVYHLKFSLKVVGDEIKQEIMRTVDELHDKEVLEDEIIVRDLAENIESLLEIVKTYNIAYEINPPYPHEIHTLNEEWTEEDIEKLMELNPGLIVSLEEMNAINKPKEK